MTREYCHRCKTITVWEPPTGHAKHERCNGCGDRFPCAKACGHLDCERARQEAKAQEVGDAARR